MSGTTTSSAPAPVLCPRTLGGPLIILWRRTVAATGGAAPAETVFATVRLGTSEGSRVVATPGFSSCDIPAHLPWDDQDMVSAFVQWAGSPFSPFGGDLLSPSIGDLLSSRARFLADVAYFARVVEWACGARRRQLLSGQMLSYSEGAAWLAYLDGGESALRNYFAGVLAKSTHDTPPRQRPTRPVYFVRSPI